MNDWACPICGGAEYRLVHSIREESGTVWFDLESDPNERKNIYECRVCSVTFTDPARFCWHVILGPEKNAVSTSAG